MRYQLGTAYLELGEFAKGEAVLQGLAQKLEVGRLNPPPTHRRVHCPVVSVRIAPLECTFALLTLVLRVCQFGVHSARDVVVPRLLVGGAALLQGHVDRAHALATHTLQLVEVQRLMGDTEACLRGQ